MAKFYFYLILSLFSMTGLLAQHNPSTDSTTTPKAHSIREWFTLGSHGGHIRTIAMTTRNKGELKDHAALAVGGTLSFHTAIYKGFQLGVGGIYTYNLASTNLAEEDPVVNQLARWERQLFDLNDPHNKTDLDRLEDLYVKYYYNNWSFTFGKMRINSPFVNPQDSRMKATAVSGSWLEGRPKHNINLHLGWFNKVSPRATTEWYSLREAIGIYNQGVSRSGNESDYYEHLQTDGFLVGGIHWKIAKNYQLKFWNTHLDNMMNSSFLEGIINADHWVFGLQYVAQHQVGDGGHPDPEKAYFTGPSFHLISGKVGYQTKKTAVSYNSSFSLGKGRFVYPRELGSLDLFTYIPRHRIEGLGRFHTQTIKFNYKLGNSTLGIAYAHTDTHLSAQYNKYHLLSHSQLNLSFDHQFHHQFEGLTLSALFMGKHTLKSTDKEPRYIYNQTDLLHFNLMLNYEF